MSEIDVPTALVSARVPLAWRSAHDREVAGMPHPRAASGLARLPGNPFRLALVQDDAASLAVVDPATGLADAIALPNAHGPRFDAPFGEKQNKPDLECCVVVTSPSGRKVIMAFGSGSTEARERIALVDVVTHEARLCPAHGLYSALHASGLARQALNIEGAVATGDRLWLFQRGNGGAVPGLASVSVAALWDHLAGGPAPLVDDVRHVTLGEIDGVALGFTDAALLDGRIWWLGSAESSPDTYDDGAVAGSALGLLDGPSAILRTPDGAAFIGKAEGLVLVSPELAWVAIDPDDPKQPAELLALTLSGWPHV